MMKKLEIGKEGKKLEDIKASVRIGKFVHYLHNIEICHTARIEIRTSISQV